MHGRERYCQRVTKIRSNLMDGEAASFGTKLVGSKSSDCEHGRGVRRSSRMLEFYYIKHAFAMASAVRSLVMRT